ncbi:hypothetical protein ACPBEI_00830 [Latilactobacillus sakei]
MREIKTYRKTTTIQAEQFDGSSKMIIKYKLYVPSGEFISPHRPMYLMYTLEGPMRVNIGDWIATGVKGEHWVIADDVFKDSYVEVSK